MSQHDYVISNDIGSAVRADINNALGAIATINSGATEPSTTYAYQLWMDTTNNVLKIRNSANSAWYTLPISPVANNTVDINGGTIDGVTLGASSAITSAVITTADINGGTIDGVTIGGSSAGAVTATNLTATGTASVAGAATFNSGNADVDFTVKGDNGNALFVDGGTNDISFYEDTGTTAKFFWDASEERLGIGTSSPTSALDVNGTVTVSETIRHSGDTDTAISFYTDTITFGTNGAERMRIDSSGNLLVGTTSAVNVNTGSNTGLTQYGSTGLHVQRDGGTAAYFGRLTSDGSFVNFAKDGTTIGSIGAWADRLAIGSVNTGLKFDDGNNSIMPFSVNNGTNRDNVTDMGYASVRFDDIYATNGTIQTSDRNEKQDIEELSEAEQRVAVAAKGLLRKYRWKDSVAEKGDEARIHFGIIAQDLQAAFEAEGLDAGRYGMFIHSTWWETYTDVSAVEAVEAVYETQTDEEGNEVQVLVSEAVEAKEAYTRTDTHDEPVEGATEKSRMGIRYPELLAFIIAAI